MRILSTIVELGTHTNLPSAQNNRIKAINLSCLAGLVTCTITTTFYFLSNEIRLLSIAMAFIFFAIPLLLNFFNKVSITGYVTYGLFLLLLCYVIIDNPDKIIYHVIPISLLPYLFESGNKRRAIFLILIIVPIATIQYFQLDWAAPSQLRVGIFIIILSYIVGIIITLKTYRASTIKKNEQLIELLKVQKDELDKQEQKLTLLNEKLIQRNEELENFVYISSHDLKEPIRNVISFLQLTQKKLNSGNTTEEKLGITNLENNAKQINDIITDLLFYSRIGNNLKFSNSDLFQLADGSAQSYNLNLKSTSQKILAKVDAALFSRLFDCLGHHYSVLQNEGNTIRLQYQKDKDKISISIEPDLSGTNQFLENYRDEKDRIIDGVNESICKKILKFHGGIFKTTNIRGELKSYYLELNETSV